MLLLQLVTVVSQFLHEATASFRLPVWRDFEKLVRSVQGFATARYFTSHVKNLFDYQFAIN